MTARIKSQGNIGMAQEEQNVDILIIGQVAMGQSAIREQDTEMENTISIAWD